MNEKKKFDVLILAKGQLISEQIFGALTLFLPGEGGISPLIVCHVTPLGRDRVKFSKNATKYCQDI